MMRVFLTGGAGQVGAPVVRWLVERGYALRVVDREPGGCEIPGADYAQCDINDYPRLRELIRGCDAVVHLAAIPRPCLGSGEQIFEINAAGTFNVFQAAAEEGIRRVVQASSINALGQFYGVRSAPLAYLPVDEEHPTFTTDAYSFSKTIIEQIGSYFWRREGISSVALRFPEVVARQDRPVVDTRRGVMQELCERLLQMAPAQRSAWYERNLRLFNEVRRKRQLEDPRLWDQMWATETLMPMDTSVSMAARHNFWGIVDERDAAQAIEKGLTAAFEGSQTLFINDQYQWTGIETDLLVELFYPEVSAPRRPFQGIESLVSIQRARDLIDYQPQYSFL